MRNTYKYTKMYSGAEPEFIEGDIFRIIIPLSEVATATVGPSSLTVSDGKINGEINREINGEINEEINLTKTDKEILRSIKNNPHPLPRLQIVLICVPSLSLNNSETK